MAATRTALRSIALGRVAPQKFQYQQVLRSSPFSTAAYKVSTFARPSLVKSCLLGSTRALSLFSSKSEPQAKAEDIKEIIETKADEAAQGTAEAVKDNVTTLIYSADSATHSAIAESLPAAGLKAGELQSLGLAHWSSPPGWVTQLLDIVGNTTHLPWWGTIMATTLILRLLISPITVSGQKNAIRLGNIQPRMKALMEDVKHHKAAGDTMAMQQAVTEVQTLMRENNANPLKSFVPILVQFPLMFSFFLALERIADSGCESFKHGGPWWTMDLTIPDPTWALPIISTAATLAVAELGFKLGTTTGGDQSQAKMVKIVFRIAAPLIGWFSTTFPSGVLLYWATTNIWSLCQMLILQVPAMRRFVKMPKRIQPAPNPYAPKEKSVMERLREVRAQMNDSTPTPVKPVSSRSEAVKQVLDDTAAKAAYEKDTGADGRMKRVLRARQRRGQ